MYARPKQSFLVVDQNCLRDDGIIEQALKDAQESDRLVLLPDVALLEMMKNDQWEPTTLGSLRALSRWPQGVVVSHAVGPLMRLERETGLPVTDLVDHDATPQIRSVLEKIARCDKNAVAQFRTTIESAQREIAAPRLNHEKNKETVVRIMERWKEILSPSGLSRIRNKHRPTMVALLASEQLRKVSQDLLCQNDYSPKASEVLTRMPSISGHVFLGLAALALHWLGLGGLETIKESKVTNDLIDQDYILLATFCDSITSKETKVNELLSIMNEVIDYRCSDTYNLLSNAGLLADGTDETDDPQG